jgi:hypothetical protein
MKDDQPVVPRQPQVALDTRAKLQGGSEGDQAIFGKAGAVVKAAVRESLLAGIERISP